MDSAHTGDRVWSDFTTQFTKFHLLEDSNIKWRLTGYGRTSGSHNSLGSYVRGVLNGSLKGDLGIFANFDWVFRVATWDGEGVVDWVGGGEFHLAPFIDMGIAHHFDTGWSPLEVTAGAEGVFFFNEARSIKLSGLLGLSLNDTVQKFKGTLDGGIEKEIIVNFSIYY